MYLYQCLRHNCFIISPSLNFSGVWGQVRPTVETLYFRVFYSFYSLWMTLKSFQLGLIQESHLGIRCFFIILCFGFTFAFAVWRFCSQITSYCSYCNISAEKGGQDWGVGVVLIKFFFHPTVTFWLKLRKKIKVICISLLLI